MSEWVCSLCGLPVDERGGPFLSLYSPVTGPCTWWIHPTCIQLAVRHFRTCVMRGEP